jgi:hypothetical protein
MKVAYNQAEKKLAEMGYQKHPRYTYDKYGGTYVHKDTKEEVNVQHYPKAGVSHIDKIDKDGNLKFEDVIYGMITTHLTEGTRGETGLVNMDGSLTQAGYKAMYAWKKAGHRGEHVGIRNEREMQRKKVVRDV